MPVSVFADRRLEHFDVLVYGLISLGHQRKRGQHPRPVSIGMRKIAKTLDVSQPTVSRSIQRLIQFGHVVRQAAKRGSRSLYEFTSSAFLMVDRRGDGIVIATGYSGVPAHVGVVPEPVSQPRLPKALRKKTA